MKLKESLDAPVKKGMKVGEVTFALNEKEVSSFDVVTSDFVDEITFSSVFLELINAMIAM